MSTRSTNRSFKKLISVNEIPAEEIYKTLCTQTVDLVFTAHPTQVRAGTYRATEPSAVHGESRSSFLVQLGLLEQRGFEALLAPIQGRSAEYTFCRGYASCLTQAASVNPTVIQPAR